MPSSRKTVVTLLLGSMLYLGCGSVADEPEVDALKQALTGCYGDRCGGADPAVMGCDRDASQIGATKNLPSGGYLKQFYSKNCSARWVKVFSAGAGSKTALIQDATGGGFMESIDTQTASTMWSNMIGNPGRAATKGCVSIKGAPSICTQAASP